MNRKKIELEAMQRSKEIIATSARFMVNLVSNMRDIYPGDKEFRKAHKHALRATKIIERTVILQEPEAGQELKLGSAF